jgi:alginate O-acetyltransferase complex protein AlgI
MLFHSAGFIFVFLLLFLVAMYGLPKGKIRACALLIFSYLFYSGGEPLFIWLLFTSSVTDYAVALQINRTTIRRKRRAWLAVSLLLNLGLLGFFKYGGWLFPMLEPYIILLGIPIPSPDFFRSFVLPAGISFYTFQSLAYTIDVYRGEVKPERSLLAFCNYVAYLPQLIAGPIERFSHLAPQLHTLTHGEPIPQWTAGLDRILLGIAQKLLLADGCGQLVDRLIVNSGPWDLLTSWAVAIGFGLQIYFDFAAYSHMAIGIALLLGVRLQENFLAPYQAASIQEFWHRWHVTLSRWFRDYLYIPLGGSRRGRIHTIFNLLVTFLLCGLWHGAGWNFLLWGILHGFYLILFRAKEALLPNWRLPHAVGVILTFALVCYAWVPFRINDTVQIVTIWRGMSGLNGWGGAGVSNVDLLILALLAAGTLIIPHAGRRWPGHSGWVESTILASIALFALFSAPSLTTFIYFQF